MGETTAAIPCSRRCASSGITSTTRSRPMTKRRWSTICRSAVDAAASSSSRRSPAVPRVRLVGGGSGRREAPPRAIRRGAIAMAKDAMYQDEIEDAVRDAYGSISERRRRHRRRAALQRGGAHRPADRRARLGARRRQPRPLRVPPGGRGRPRYRVRWWHRHDAGGAPRRSHGEGDRPRHRGRDGRPARLNAAGPASTGGRSSCLGRWSRSRSPTPLSTW